MNQVCKTRPSRQQSWQRVYRCQERGTMENKSNLAIESEQVHQASNSNLALLRLLPWHLKVSTKVKLIRCFIFSKEVLGRWRGEFDSSDCVITNSQSLQHLENDPTDVTVSPVEAHRAHRTVPAEQSFPDQGTQSSGHVDLRYGRVRTMQAYSRFLELWSQPIWEVIQSITEFKGEKKDGCWWFHSTTGPTYLTWLILMAKYIHTNLSGWICDRRAVTKNQVELYEMKKH